MSNAKPQKWTDDQIQYFLDGKNDQEIGLLTGRSSTCVSVKRTTLKKSGKISQDCKSRKVKNLSAGQKAAITRRVNKEKNLAVGVPVESNRAKKGSKDLHFVINGIPVLVANSCKNVLIGTNKILIDF